MSCGSGQLLADLISGRQPAIQSNDLSVQRYHDIVSVRSVGSVTKTHPASPERREEPSGL
ncbi:hypothetical protein ACFFG5_15665, partial [Paraburkholderia humisilvae]